MNRWLLLAACAAVRAWTWLYTLPLDSTAKRRRDEIDSDLWEYRNDRSRHHTGAANAVHLLTGAVLAIPDDLLWACEQMPNHLRLPRVSAILRFAIAAVAASTLVVSASGPTLDVVSVLEVNVASAGWIPVAGSGTESTLAPAFAFTLTNTGDRPTSALQVNAVFYRRNAKRDGFGAAFSPVVGWRGLIPGATSDRVVLRGQRRYIADDGSTTAYAPFARLSVDELRVRVFVQHEGRWTLLGDFPIPAEAIHA